MNFGIAQETLKDRQEEKYQEFYKFFTSAVSQKGKKDVYNYFHEDLYGNIHLKIAFFDAVSTKFRDLWGRFNVLDYSCKSIKSMPIQTGKRTTKDR